MKHAILGASTAKRWMNCPGSVKLSVGMPNHSSAAAEEGTAAHELAELILEKGTCKNTHLGKKAENGVMFTAEMQDAVLVYTDYVHELMETSEYKSVLFLEHSFSLESVYDNMFGTNDACVYNPDTQHLDVLDYKHGAGIFVDVEDNPQLKYYALGALLTLDVEIKSIRIYIVQPRIACDEGTIRYQDITPKDLMDFAIELYNAAELTEQEDAKLEAGDHCTFCPVVLCPAMIEHAKKLVELDFKSELPYDPDELSETLKMADVIVAWAKGVKSFAYNQAEAGVKTPHYKLVAKRATRKWIDESGMRKTFKTFKGHKIGEFYTEKIKTPPQVEKLLGKEFKKGLVKYVKSESSGTTLVHESDKRPEAANAAEDDFKTEIKQEK